MTNNTFKRSATTIATMIGSVCMLASVLPASAKTAGQMHAKNVQKSVQPKTIDVAVIEPILPARSLAPKAKQTKDSPFTSHAQKTAFVRHAKKTSTKGRISRSTQMKTVRGGKRVATLSRARTPSAKKTVKKSYNNETHA